MDINTLEKQASKSHILIVDDDTRICTLVSRFLHEHDFIVLTAENANEADSIMKSFAFDALIVDVMMPEKTGTEFIKELRAKGQDTPALLLTALGEAEDRIAGFECGADDYLPKPFEPMELVLRLKAILRRTKSPQENISLYQIGKWQFDTKHDELRHEDKILDLTSMEANLLRALALSEGEVVSRTDLALRCSIDAGERTIDVQVTRLRRKIEENTKTPRYLQTVRGKGYLLRARRV